MNKNNTLIFAHRGASDTAPENTMAAFEFAKKHGADGIELDVMLSKDNKLIVLHDDTIDRTSDGSGLAGSFEYSELMKYDFGSWSGDEFKNERIPLFEDVAKFIKENNMLLNIEIKPSLKSDMVENEVIRICKKYDIVEQSHVSSFNHFALLRLKSKFDKLDTAILYSSGLVDVGKYAKEHVKADAIHPHYLAMIPETIKSAKEYGLKIRPWTVDSADVFMQFKNTNSADAVITNCPMKMRKALE